MKNQGGRRREFSMSRILSIFVRTSVCGLLLLFIVTTASGQFKAGIRGQSPTPGGDSYPRRRSLWSILKPGKRKRPRRAAKGSTEYRAWRLLRTNYQLKK